MGRPTSWKKAKRAQTIGSFTTGENQISRQKRKKEEMGDNFETSSVSKTKQQQYFAFKNELMKAEKVIRALRGKVERRD